MTPEAGILLMLLHSRSTTSVNAWSTELPSRRTSASRYVQPPSSLWPRRRSFLGPLLDSNFVDVDFERIDDDSKDTNQELTDPYRMKSDKELEDALEESTRNSLFDLSLQATDPELKDTPIPFFDYKGERYISTKLAFMTELDGETYGIAVPFEHAAAMTLETTKDGKVSYLSPDNDDNEELMEIMAGQLQEHLGEDLKLKRTPRVLTISGPLDSYTKNWKKDVIPKPVDRKTLLEEDDDDDLEFFHNFMKQELGEEEYEKTLNEDPSDIDKELLDLFNIPGIGDQEDDTEGMKELFQSAFRPIEEQKAEMKEFVGYDRNLNHDGVALKLISYRLPDGKAYSLVQLLQPYALVGKCTQEDGDIRFELLSPEEERILVPKLEEVCRNDLESAGLKLAS